jgi:hypothetical protein
MQSDIDQDIKATLQQAVKYVEGRGIQLDMRNRAQLAEISKLIDIKLSY